MRSGAVSPARGRGGPLAEQQAQFVGERLIIGGFRRGVGPVHPPKLPDQRDPLFNAGRCVVGGRISSSAWRCRHRRSMRSEINEERTPATLVDPSGRPAAQPVAGEPEDLWALGRPVGAVGSGQALPSGAA